MKSRASHVFRAGCALCDGTWMGCTRAEVQPMCILHPSKGRGTFFSFAQGSPIDPRRVWGRKMWELGFESCKVSCGRSWILQGGIVSPHFQIPCWECAYSLKFSNSKISPHSTFVVICRYAQRGEEWVAQYTVLSWGWTRCSAFFKLSYDKQCCLRSIFTAILFTFLCSLFMISLFKLAPKHSAKALSSFSKRKGTVTCMEEIVLLGELHSGRSHSAVGHTFIDNEPTIFTT